MSSSTPFRPVIRPIHASHTHPLRHAVLWPDKPMSYVQLAEDETGQHFGAFMPNKKGAPGLGEGEDKPVSVISLFIDGQAVARFRKFATDPSWQGKGIGSALLRHTIDAARKAGAASIWCDARQSAAVFYQRFGMGVMGDVFYKGEIPYVRMSKELV
ncbi:GCN5-like N-acetyltransferase [Xylariomycetidae sp. FL2044]|nr:GCN5-like N-acetyltransferase [Xylariomycetidae sp. FL2044]